MNIRKVTVKIHEIFFLFLQVIFTIYSLSKKGNWVVNFLHSKFVSFGNLAH
jgi:hypothetical protein